MKTLTLNVFAWLWIRPTRLPRSLTTIAVCLVYNPQGRSADEQRDLDEYLLNTTDSIQNNYPNRGIVFLGDFKNFDTSNLSRSLGLKQIVTSPTRGSAILDLHDLYNKPRILVPLGSADHNIVQWATINVNITSKPQTKRLSALFAAIRDLQLMPLVGGLVHINGSMILVHVLQ